MQNSRSLVLVPCEASRRRRDEIVDLGVSHLADLLFAGSIIHLIVVLGEAHALEQHLGADLTDNALGANERVLRALLQAVGTALIGVLDVYPVAAFDVVVEGLQASVAGREEGVEVIFLLGGSWRRRASLRSGARQILRNIWDRSRRVLRLVGW